MVEVVTQHFLSSRQTSICALHDSSRSDTQQHKKVPSVLCVCATALSPANDFHPQSPAS
jgi:hypothetical protein